VPAVMDWINEKPDAPFFAIIWTGMTHYPYYTGDDVQTYVEDDDLNKYLNALRTGDQALGDLTKALEAAGHLDDTLIVVLGDHGEAFGEHGTYSHASAIYEENLHIPLLFVNRKLFSGQSSQIIAGTSDVAPTVLDLMGLPAPASWQGQSLFARGRPDGMLFFAPWNGFQIGFRDGSRKFMANAHTGKIEIYDLATDPDERINLAPLEPEAVAAAQVSLASWIRTQDRRTLALLSAQDSQAAVSDTAPTKIVIYATGTFYQTPPIAEVQLDGQPIGSISVSSSLSNADVAVDEAAIAAAVSPYSLPLPDVSCPKHLSITFANDAWAGEGQSGDTNLSIARIDIGDKQYWPWQFTLLTDSAGAEWEGLYTFWTNGSAGLTLSLDPSCLATGFVGDIPAALHEASNAP
jgi:lipoteichoic acid synthase